jgi:outer membrane protein TolC
MSRRAFAPPLLAAGLLLTAAVPRAAETGEPQTLDLRGALRLMEERNVAVVAAEERVRQAEEGIVQSRSVLGPQATASISETRQTRNLAAQGITLPRQDPVVGPFNTFDARLRLTQTLFDESARGRLESARAGRALSEAEARKAREDALALAAALYVRARRAAESAAVWDVLVRRDEDRLRLARARTRLGTGAAVDASEADAALAASRQGAENARVEAEDARLDLAAALGLPADRPLIFAAEDALTEPAVPEGEALEAAVREHPDVLAARRAYEARTADRRAARADYYPRASLAADYGASGVSPSEASATYSYGAQASLPLWEGGQRRARARETESQAAESRARLEDAERRTKFAIASAGESLSRARIALAARRSARSAADERRRLARERSSAGVGSSSDVLEAEAHAARARDQEAAARADWVLAQVNLAKALGRIESLIAPSSGPAERP